MFKTIEGVVDESGRIKLTEPVTLNASQRVLVTLLETEEDERFVKGLPATAVLAESALREYWDRPEEDEAWKEFQNEGT